MNDPGKFAADWAESWNRRDVEAVLAHFHDDTVFTSPSALKFVGVPTVRGKEALRAYWNKAMPTVKTIHFTVERVLWDEQRRELAIIYVENINGAPKRVSENLRFDAAGLVVSAEVFHGVPVTL